MARARNIKPGFFRNEDLAECSVWARLLFPGLWMLADREGRLEDRPKRIKGEVFPFDSVEVDQLLNELSQWRFIHRYIADGKKCIQINNFVLHQAPHGTERDSALPDVDGFYTVNERAKNGYITGKFCKTRPAAQEKPDVTPVEPAAPPLVNGATTVNPPLVNGATTVNPPSDNALNPDSPNPDSPNPESNTAATVVAAAGAPASGGATSAKVAQKQQPALKRRSALPADFLPNENGLRLAAEKRLTLADELQKFCNYHAAKGSLMADWQAAWRSWVGNALASRRTAAGHAAPAESFKERDARLGRERWEQMTGRRHPDNLPQSAPIDITALNTPQRKEILQ